MQEVVQPIARSIKRLREGRNLSISALAERAGVSKSTVSNLERGIDNPSIDTLWLLARVLGLPFAALFEEDRAVDVDVLRFEDAPVVARSGRGVRQRDPNGHGFGLRHLVRFHARGEVEAYILDLEADARRSAEPHATGVVEHVIVVSGRVDIGAEASRRCWGPATESASTRIASTTTRPWVAPRA